MATWFITGTSSGFGRLLTERLIERGDSVAATIRRPGVLDELREKAEDRLWVGEVDLRDEVAVERTVRAAFAHFGTIDTVVNNAGFGLLAAAEEASREQMMRALDVNLVASMDVIRAAIPFLREQGRGRIVQISSAGGQTTYPGFSYYHAAKWGIEGFCETLRKELQPFGITVMIVEPGATPTRFAAAAEAGQPIDAYETGPIGDLRQAVADGTFQPGNDPERIRDAILGVLDGSSLPLRLTLGQDAFADIHADYVARLAELEGTRERALSVATSSF